MIGKRQIRVDPYLRHMAFRAGVAGYVLLMPGIGMAFLARRVITRKVRLKRLVRQMAGKAREAPLAFSKASAGRQ